MDDISYCNERGKATMLTMVKKIKKRVNTSVKEKKKNVY
jgi:hypothetical protein